MTLYEIDEQIMSCVDVETGEIFDGDKFDELKLEKEAKIENLCLWMKNLKSDAEQLKAEAESFTKRAKAAENKYESIKAYLQNYLDGEKFKTTKCSVSYRKSTSVVVDDLEAIPDEFIRYKVEANKTAIAEALKAGFELEGAHLEDKQSIIVK